MAVCVNHPDLIATQNCAQCARPFCDNCLVELEGARYCGTCKNNRVRDLQRVESYKLPGEALTYSIVGLFCFGIILEPMALIKSNQALKEIAANPSLPGREKAVAARWIAIVGIGLWVVAIIIQILAAAAGVK